jgi:hypothetical protein
MRSGTWNYAAMFLLDPHTINSKKLGLNTDLFLIYFFHRF